MPAGPYNDIESEFWYNVMPQAEMPVAGEIESDFNVERLAAFLAETGDYTKADFKDRVKSALLNEPDLFHDLRQLLGITDKRAYLELSYNASRTPHPLARTGLCGCQPWNMSRHPLDFFLRLISGAERAEIRSVAGDLLADFLMQSGLGIASVGFAGLSSKQLSVIYRTIVLPREVQQRAAKRRGHGCEGALASVLHLCGVNLLPEDKHTNAIGARDPNLDLDTLRIVPRKKGRTYSFDMAILDGDLVRVAIQSLIHTSDPGQYGVNKSDETVAIARHFERANASYRKQRPIELWGLVDGIGFSENKSDTINKMLANFDCFVQLNTLYKAPLRLHILGLLKVKCIRFRNYTPEDIQAICTKYVPKGIAILGPAEKPDPAWSIIEAGRATIYC